MYPNFGYNILTFLDDFRKPNSKRDLFFSAAEVDTGELSGAVLQWFVNSTLILEDFIVSGTDLPNLTHTFNTVIISFS